jgi:iron complex transport system ATP-binding protein
MSDDQAGQWRLECDRLTVRRAGCLVLSEVTVSIGRAECVSLVGPNGSGKTTLLLALAGLLPATTGAVRRYSAREWARLLAYVPQSVERAPAFRLRDVVLGGRYVHVGALRPASPADERAVQAALARCGLADLAERRFDAVSGGERQKTLIAAAIAQDAQMLLLDEPNTALDPAYQLELVRILREWHAAGRGLLVVSHDLQLPAALGGRVLALRKGQIAADGPAEQVLVPEVLSDIYGAPFATAVTADGTRVVLPTWW